jgi:oligoribonuclease
MTGLDSQSDTILEIACFVTDSELNLLDTVGFETVIHHSQEALDRMGDWCQKHHGVSGLTDRALNSKVSPEDAAASLLEYVKKHVPQPRKALLAGNSVYADKMFLVKPPYDCVMNHLHYRILDVSSIKEAVRRWAADDVRNQVPKKKGLHQAKADILESIEEARYYRKALFKQ